MPGETNEREIIIPDDILTAVTVGEATALATLARDKTVLELGAFYGFSTVVLASVAELVVSVDWHQGDDHAGKFDTYAGFMCNLTRHGVRDRVKVVKQRFDEALPGLAKFDWQFDGCFLDAHHSEESVRADLALALPLIKPGGFMAFHDYGRSELTGNPGFGVTQAADDLIGIRGRVGFLGWGFTPDAG